MTSTHIEVDRKARGLPTVTHAQRPGESYPTFLTRVEADVERTHSDARFYIGHYGYVRRFYWHHLGYVTSEVVRLGDGAVIG